ncbi:uncharacterized protein [Palaemon carinicauda]|uniref:uncharacterized protein n=1 Tax=Palaemon carinicauda TaxID=392227 RepID=UPI0035B5D8F2
MDKVKSMFVVVLWCSVSIPRETAASGSKIGVETHHDTCSDEKAANSTTCESRLRSSSREVDGSLQGDLGSLRDDLGSLPEWQIENASNLTDDHDRDERLLFSVIRFANGACTSGGEIGACMTKWECARIGGSVIGTCAKGFGTCCYKAITCGGSSSSNCTYLVSPNYPGSYNEARSCSMSITRGSGICQLRLDFKEFTSSQPDDFGVCNEDRFTVNEERKFTFLCGNAPTDWHFYLDVNGKSNPTVFNFDTSSVSFDRKFKIKVTMIECSKKIPGGCGQYYTGASGSFASFNYGGPYLAGLDYGICFRKEKNLCTTTLTTLGYSFTNCPDLYKLPVGASNGNLMLQPSAENLYCQTDVNNPFFATVNKVPSPITTLTNGPLTIWHHTNTDAIPNFFSNANCRSCAGFYQMYSHNPC